MPALEHKLADPNTPFVERLRILCGYVENGSDTAVTVFQDDATTTWCVRVGLAFSSTARRYYGSSMDEAFAKAFADPLNNPF